jgi:ribosome maturation factor RimP
MIFIGQGGIQRGRVRDWGLGPLASLPLTAGQQRDREPSPEDGPAGQELAHARQHRTVDFGVTLDEQGDKSIKGGGASRRPRPSNREAIMTNASSTAGSSGGSAGAGKVLVDLLAPVATAAGFDLEDVEVVPAGRRKLVRITVDRDGGLDLDAVAEVSREFDAVLDRSTDVDRLLGKTPFTLEVSSPGVDRPLTEPRHWRRAVGRLVDVRLQAGGEASGRIVGADDHAVTIATAAGERTVPYTELGRGRVQLEFNRKSPTDTEGGEQ